MGTRGEHSLRWSKGLLAGIVASSLLLILTVTVWASTTNIYDSSHVLNASQVRKAGSSLPYPVDVYTVPNFGGSQSQFVRQAESKLTDPNKIVMAISTGPLLRYVQVVYGQNVPLGNGGAASAANAFINTYKSSNNYTSATVASMNALHTSLGTTSGPTGGSAATGWLLAGLILLALIAFFVFMRRARRSGLLRQPAYNGPQQSGRGANPLAAGGLGAAAGGLAGYELGRRQANERAGRENQEGYSGSGASNLGSGGDFGSKESNPSGGSGGDFGSDGRSGGSFGRENSGNRGSGGDFGSGGSSGGSLSGGSGNRGSGGDFGSGGSSGGSFGGSRSSGSSGGDFGRDSGSGGSF